MCNNDGEVEFWDWVRLDNYPDQMASWDHPVPTGIRLARLWYILSITFAVVTFQKIKSRGKLSLFPTFLIEIIDENIRSFILASMLFCFISGVNIYGFNLVQSSTVIPGRFEDNLPFNAHCSVGVSFNSKNLINNLMSIILPFMMKILMINMHLK